MDSPTCNSLLETSRTINHLGQHESSVCIPEPVTRSSSNQETVSDISRTGYDKQAQLIPQKYMSSTSNERKFSARYFKAYEWIEYKKILDFVFYLACSHFLIWAVRTGETSGNEISLSQEIKVEGTPLYCKLSHYPPP